MPASLAVWKMLTSMDADEQYLNEFLNDYNKKI